jgi:hypothetical protein
MRYMLTSVLCAMMAGCGLQAAWAVPVWDAYSQFNGTGSQSSSDTWQYLEGVARRPCDWVPDGYVTSFGYTPLPWHNDNPYYSGWAGWASSDSYDNMTYFPAII